MIFTIIVFTWFSILLDSGQRVSLSEIGQNPYNLLRMDHCNLVFSSLPSVPLYIQETSTCSYRENKISSVNNLSDLLFLQSNSPLFLYFSPSTEAEFFTIVSGLSDLFDSSELLSVWKPKIVIYFPSSDTLIRLSNSENAQLDRVREHLTFTNFSLNSEVYVVFETTTGTLDLLELYNYKNLSSFKLVKEFEKNCNFRTTIYEYVVSEPIFNRRYNLSEIQISAVAQNDPDYQPRIQITNYPNDTAEFAGGMCLSVLKDLQYALGFSYKALDGKGWVGLFPNGSWTGMSGQVVNEEADLSIAQASTIMMTDQLHGISFLHPTSYGRLVGIFRQPPASSIRNIVTTAFKPLLWGCGFITWIILLIGIHLMFKIIRTKNVPHVKDDDMFIEESVWWAVAITCGIGWHLTPDFRPLRAIFASGCFLASFVFVAYSASLMTTLSTETLPIKDLYDLSESAIDIFGDKWLPVAHKIVQEVYKSRKAFKIVMDDHYIQLESAIPRILKQPSAFITFSDAISVVFHRLEYTDSFVCSTVHSVIVSKVPFPNAMFVKKGNPLKEILNVKILAMIERGCLSRHNKLYDTQTQLRCPTLVQHYRGGLVMTDVLTPFLLLISGAVLSSFVLIVERFRFNRIITQRNELNQQNVNMWDLSFVYLQSNTNTYNKV